MNMAPAPPALGMAKQLIASATTDPTLTEYRSRLEQLGSRVAGPLVASGVEWSAPLKGGRAVRMRAPTYVPLDVRVLEAQRSARDALHECGVLEHRALVTGAEQDAQAYLAALPTLDVALAELWALEAANALVGRSAVSRRRVQLNAQFDAVSARITQRLAKGRAGLDDGLLADLDAQNKTHALLQQERPLPGSATLDIPLRPPLVTDEDATKRAKRAEASATVRRAVTNKVRRRAPSSASARTHNL